MAIENEDERNFVEKLYNDYKHAMFRVARAILKDDDKADDAVSSAFVKIIAHAGDYKSIPCNKIKGLVVIIVRNVSINMLDRENAIQFTSFEEDWTESDNDAETAVMRNYEYNMILDAIGKLDEKYLSVMGLKYLQGYTDAEIANLLDISHANVRVRLHRDRRQLSELLGSDNDE
jgi:RNA polymerase sigma-70 factor (ECF subfamily)